jgi:C4-type Zn-finger protein
LELLAFKDESTRGIVECFLREDKKMRAPDRFTMRVSDADGLTLISGIDMRVNKTNM